MIRTLLVEDHAMVRAGLRALLEHARDVEVIGEAANGHEAVDLARRLRPDLMIMDIMMPRLNGIQAAEQIRELKLPVKILLLSMYSDEGLVHQAVQGGVNGYVLKTSVSDELLEAVRAVSRGETFLSAEISSIADQHTQSRRSVDGPIDSLSPREKEILQLIAEEHTSGEIAELLSISEKTVEKHRASLMEKLSVRNLAGLVRLAVKFGLVER